MLGLLLAAALAAPAAAGAQARTVTVSAASSLTDVLQQLAAIYEVRTGEHVTLNFAASNTLARQIAAGARVDLFISADEAQIAVVKEQMEPGMRTDLVSNQLAVAVPDDRPRRFQSMTDLTDPAVRRIAVADPAAVPAGVYAKAYLQRLGIWEAVASKIVPTASVRLALAAVENGAADAAIVYRSDIRTARRAREAFVVSASEGPRIVYPAVRIRTGRNREGALRFLLFLESAEAGRIFERWGFVSMVRPRTVD